MKASSFSFSVKEYAGCPGAPVELSGTGAEITLRAPETSAARLMLLGGEPLDGARHIWWNFVASSRERIEQAKENWKAGQFAPVSEETEFILLPGAEPAVMPYP